MMIDEATLTAVLREAGDAIEVPEGGAERVLAARGAPASPRVTPSPFRRAAPGRGPTSWSGSGRNRAIAGGIAAVVVLFVAIGLAASHHSSSFSSSSGTTTASGSVAGTTAGGAVSAGTTTNGSSAGSGGSSSAAKSAGLPLSNAQPPSSATTVPAGGQVEPLPTQVVKTGVVGVLVKTGQVDTSVDRLTAIAAGLDGYVQSSQTSSSGGSPTASMVLRVPVASFDQLVAEAEALGKVTTVTTSGQDVTAQSVDLAAQIQALEASRDQFLQILTKAQTIGDILSVEQQISGLQTQISQLQGQQKVLSSQASYSTLTVDLAQPATAVIVPPPPPRRSGLSAAWAHARRSFTHGVESVVSASGGLAVFFLCVGVVAGLGWLGWRVARRRLV